MCLSLITKFRKLETKLPKKGFTIIHKIFETNSSLHVKLRNTGKF